MRSVKIVFIIFIGLILAKCSGSNNERSVVDSKSFARKQIELDASLAARLVNDSVSERTQQASIDAENNELLANVRQLQSSDSEPFYLKVCGEWEAMRQKLDLNPDSVSLRGTEFMQWIEINSRLLKYYGEVRFADELQKLLDQKAIAIFSEQDLKSVIYTHVDDHIFINLIVPSSLTHYHTTGGTVKLSQHTGYPESNEMILSCECSDVRYLDVYIRIPGWAVNPKVTHGNVKYVARPGEYCQISRKWKNGDEILVTLKN
jgi:hypothetical protein